MLLARLLLLSFLDSHTQSVIILSIVTVIPNIICIEVAMQHQRGGERDAHNDRIIHTCPHRFSGL